MGQKFLDEYLAPKMQQPQMPTFSPAVMSGQMSPEQAQASGINVMPQGPQFSGIDRWLPLINAAAGALSTPGSPTQPLAPLGGAIGGFAQGRLQQIQLERQAAAPYQQVALDMYARQREAAMARQANETRGTELRAEADKEEAAGNKDKAAQLRSLADLYTANVPEAARFTTARPLSPEQARSYSATADLREKQAKEGPTTKTKEERQGDRETQAVDRTLQRFISVFNKSLEGMSGRDFTDALKDPKWQAVLKNFARMEGAPFERVLGEAQGAGGVEDKPGPWEGGYTTPGANAKPAVPSPSPAPDPTTDPLGIL